MQNGGYCLCRASSGLSNLWKFISLYLNRRKPNEGRGALLTSLYNGGDINSSKRERDCSFVRNCKLLDYLNWNLGSAQIAYRRRGRHLRTRTLYSAHYRAVCGRPKTKEYHSIGNSRATGMSVEDCCVSPSLNKVDFFIYLFLFYHTDSRRPGDNNTENF